jgi:hypothetical protein
VDITLQEVADIVDESKGRNYFSNQLESSLQPLFKKLKSVESSKETLSVSSLFNLDENKSKKFKDRYEKVLEAFLSGYESMTKNMGIGDIVNTPTGNKPPKLSPKPSEGVAKILAGSGIKTPSTKVLPPSEGVAKILASIQGKKDLTEEGVVDKIMDVNVISLSDTVLKQLGSARESTAVVIEQPDKGSDGRKDSNGSLLSKIGMAIKGLTMAGLAAGLLVGGVSLAMKGLIDGGPTKGLFKLVGNVLISIGNLIFKKFGTIIKNVMAPMGKLFSFNMGKGLTKKVGSILNTSFGKLFKPLLNIGKTMGKGAKLVFKSIPFLGSIISLAFAVSRFKDGDMVGGLLELTSALLGLIPIPALALIPDVILMFRDFTMSKSEKKSSGGSWMMGLRNWFMDLPVIQAFSNLFTGLSMIFTGGDIDQGLAHLKLAKDLLWLIPPLIPMLDVIEIVKDPSKFINAGKAVFSGLGTGLAWLWEKLGDILDTIWNSAAKVLDNLMSSGPLYRMKLRFDIGIMKLMNSLTGFMRDINLVIWKAEEKILYAKEKQTFLDTTKRLKIRAERQALNDLINAKPTDSSDIAKFNKLEKALNDSITKQSNADKAALIANKNAEDSKNDERAEQRHKEQLESNAGVAQAMVASNQAGSAKVAQAVMKRSDGGTTNNVFTDSLSKRSAEVKKRSFQHIYR